MRFKMVILIVFLSFTGLCLFDNEAGAKTVKGIVFKNFTNIKKYDVTGDGKADTVRIDCKNQIDPYNDGLGTGWRIRINGKIVYKNKKRPDFLTVTFYPVTKKRLYLDVEENYADNDDICNHGLYQYSDGKLKMLQDFYNPVMKCIHEYHYYVGITRMSEKKMVVSGSNQFNATSGLSWEMVYKYSSGKWKLSGNTHKVTGGVNKTQHKTGYWTLNRNMVFYKKPGSGAKAFSLSKGDRLKIKKICLKNKKTYMQVTAKNGKKGWFEDLKKNDWGCFKECVFAG